MDDATLLEVLIDIKTEIAAIHKLLLVAEVDWAIQEGTVEDESLASEREAVRTALLLKYPSLLSSSRPPSG